MSEETEVKLTDRQSLFCIEYVKDLNATQAAIRAGYSVDSARFIGHENLTKPYIRQNIDNYLRGKVISSEETVKLISDIAKSSLNDYLTVRTIEKRRKVVKPIQDKINELGIQIQKKRRLQELSDWTEERSDENFKDITNIEEQILELQIELEFNPEATIIDWSEPELAETTDIDMVKLAKDKELGRIKSLSWTESGLPKVELYAADAALVNMARIHGKFEKDNEQRQPVSDSDRAARIQALKAKMDEI
jgi:phage terminase small subunit